MGFSDYNSNPDLNVSISGVNIGEGCPPSGINNAIRQIMADAKTADGGYVKGTTSGGAQIVSSSTTFVSSAVFSGGVTFSSGISGQGSAVIYPASGSESTPGWVLDPGASIFGGYATIESLNAGAGTLKTIVEVDKFTGDATFYGSLDKPDMRLEEYTLEGTIMIPGDGQERVYFTPPTISGYTAKRVVSGRANGVLGFVIPEWGQSDNAWVINTRPTSQTANSLTFLIQYVKD